MVTSTAHLTTPVKESGILTPSEKGRMTRECGRLARLLGHSEGFHETKWARLFDAANSIGHPVVQAVLANWHALPDKERERYLKNAQWWQASKERKRQLSNVVGLFGPIRNCFRDREEPTMADLLTQDRPIPKQQSGELTTTEKNKLLAIRARAIGTEYQT